MKVMNLTDPDHMSTEARLNEVATILAAGYLRHARKQQKEKISVDKSANQCPYGQKPTKGERP